LAAKFNRQGVFQVIEAGWGGPGRDVDPRQAKGASLAFAASGLD
jgi:hypothetical protein